jgi:hypothetical protein
LFCNIECSKTRPAIIIGDAASGGTPPSQHSEAGSHYCDMSAIRTWPQ